MEQYIQPFIQVCTHVFRILLHCDIVPGRTYFIKKDAFLEWDISGIIALSGGAKGLVALSMKNSTAVKIATILTNMRESYIETDTTDAIGEIANIIAGNVKKSLEDNFKISISLPKVVKGKAHFVVIPENRTRLLCIPFTIFAGETFWLSLSID
jgi:chemotaxis protein CheX